MKNQQRLARYAESGGRKSAMYKFPRGTIEYKVTLAQRRRLKKNQRPGKLASNPTPPRGVSRRPGGAAL